MRKYLAAIIILLAGVSRVFAAGMTTHEFITEIALKNLADPELKHLLESHRNLVLTACNFPDTGTSMDYLIGHKGKPNYGGLTHWPPFAESYLAYIEPTAHAL